LSNEPKDLCQCLVGARRAVPLLLTAGEAAMYDGGTKLGEPTAAESAAYDLTAPRTL